MGQQTAKFRNTLNWKVPRWKYSDKFSQKMVNFQNEYRRW